MTWTFELEQKKDKDGNLLPLWKVTQWNTNNDKIRWETEITDAIKKIVYPED